MKICPISNYQSKCLTTKQTKSNSSKSPTFKQFYPEAYTAYCKKHPDFVYKVPDIIFKKMDSFHNSYGFLSNIYDTITSWQKRLLPDGIRTERIGFINDKVKIVEQGLDDFGYDPHFAVEDSTVFDENLNKIIEIGASIPSRPGGAGGLYTRTDYYPQSSIPEYRVISGSIKAPWRDYHITHYSPHGVLDKEYVVKDSLIGDSNVTVKDVINNKTEEFFLFR